jgi:hypothetical protein
VSSKLELANAREAWLVWRERERAARERVEAAFDVVREQVDRHPADDDGADRALAAVRAVIPTHVRAAGELSAAVARVDLELERLGLSLALDSEQASSSRCAS